MQQPQTFYFYFGKGQRLFLDFASLGRGRGGAGARRAPFIFFPEGTTQGLLSLDVVTLARRARALFVYASFRDLLACSCRVSLKAYAFSFSY